MTKISAEDVVALMDADWHWKPEHKSLVRALEAVRVAAGYINSTLIHSVDCDAWDTEPFGPDYDNSKCQCGVSALGEALAAVDRIREGKAPESKLAAAVKTARGGDAPPSRGFWKP